MRALIAPADQSGWHDDRWAFTGDVDTETRKTKRVRLFTEFVSRRLAAHAPLLAGLPRSRDTWKVCFYRKPTFNDASGNSFKVPMEVVHTGAAT